MVGGYAMLFLCYRGWKGPTRSEDRQADLSATASQNREGITPRGCERALERVKFLRSRNRMTTWLLTVGIVNCFPPVLLQAAVVF
jgi:hypothetical protein